MKRGTHITAAAAQQVSEPITESRTPIIDERRATVFHFTWSLQQQQLK